MSDDWIYSIWKVALESNSGLPSRGNEVIGDKCLFHLCIYFVCLSVYLSIHPSLPFYLSIHLSVCLSISVCLSVSLSLYGSTVLLLDLGRFFSFLILYTVVRTPWTGDQPVARLLPTHRTKQTRNKRTQTSVPWVVFEPTIPACKLANKVYALDHAATVIGKCLF
jgi:hypothetical protein